MDIKKLDLNIQWIVATCISFPYGWIKIGWSLVGLMAGQGVHPLCLLADLTLTLNDASGGIKTVPVDFFDQGHGCQRWSATRSIALDWGYRLVQVPSQSDAYLSRNPPGTDHWCHWCHHFWPEKTLSTPFFGEKIVSEILISFERSQSISTENHIFSAENSVFKRVASVASLFKKLWVYMPPFFHWHQSSKWSLFLEQLILFY